MASPEAAAAELASIREPNAFIVDDVAFIRPEHGFAIGRGIGKRGIRKRYYLETRADVLWRKSPKRTALGNFDRSMFDGLYRLTPGIVEALAIVRPETVIRSHRGGFRSSWRWKSGRRGERPKVPLEIRQLVRGMSLGRQRGLAKTATLEDRQHTSARQRRYVTLIGWCRVQVITRQ